MKKYLYLFFLISSSLLSMKQPSTSLQKNNSLFVYGLPCTDNPDEGGESEEEMHAYIKKVLNTNIELRFIPNPKKIDFGQNNCINMLVKALKDENKNGIVYAFSQGTATILNYLSNKNNKKIHALILEGTLSCPNHAVYYVATNKFKFLKKMPFLYYLLPYIAKLLEKQISHYKPTGQQPILTLSNFVTDIPIIFIHAKQDPLSPYQDTCALYYLLTQKNHNIYLIHIDKRLHRELLEKDTDENIKIKKIINNILIKHNVITGALSKTEKQELEEYQPDRLQFKNDYEQLIEKESKHKYTKAILTVNIAQLANISRK